MSKLFGTNNLATVVLLIFFAFLGATCERNASADPAAVSSDLETYPPSGGLPVPVKVGLYVTDLAMIDEAAEDFEIQGYLYATWYDGRLIDKTASVADHARRLDSRQVWSPQLDIENLRTFKSFRVDFFCHPDGTVFWEEHFDAVLSAEYYLRRFPFDSQSLYVIVQPSLSPTRADHEMIDFAADSYAAGVSTNTYLAAWNVNGVTYSRDFASTKLAGLVVPQARFKISVTRRSGFYIWQVFFPILLMVMIPWSVFWIKTDEFDWQMKIPLTVMLTMIAFDFAIARDLPRVSYLTFLDAVLLTSFAFAFLSVLETLLVHVLTLQGKSLLAAEIQIHARWVVPGAYLMVLLTLLPTFFGGAGRPR